jgi:hypothetical protein
MTYFSVDAGVCCGCWAEGREGQGKLAMGFSGSAHGSAAGNLIAFHGNVGAVDVHWDVDL